jgi:5-deoxy-glucuronate isomerase
VSSALKPKANDIHTTAGGPVSLSQEDAGWKYISFRLWNLRAGQIIREETGGEEVGLVILSGRASVSSEKRDWGTIGARESVFDGPPYVVYFPPGTDFSVMAESECQVARAGAVASRGPDAYLISPADVKEDPRGEGNARRCIRHVLEADRPAEHLFLVEVITPSGNWSSYPPHKHDTEDYPRETYLEEVYYHRIRPSQGFGFQRVYSPDRGTDSSIVIRDGSLVVVPFGYHPAVIAPGYELYYLNVMAGPIREWRFTDDPDHAWVSAGWPAYGAAAREDPTRPSRAPEPKTDD